MRRIKPLRRTSPGRNVAAVLGIVKGRGRCIGVAAILIDGVQGRASRRTGQPPSLGGDGVGGLQGAASRRSVQQSVTNAKRTLRRRRREGEGARYFEY